MVTYWRLPVTDVHHIVFLSYSPRLRGRGQDMCYLFLPLTQRIRRHYFTIIALIFEMLRFCFLFFFLESVLPLLGQIFICSGLG